MRRTAADLRRGRPAGLPAGGELPGLRPATRRPGGHPPEQLRRGGGRHLRRAPGGRGLRGGQPDHQGRQAEVRAQQLPGLPPALRELQGRRGTGRAACGGAFAALARPLRPGRRRSPRGADDGLLEPAGLGPGRASAPHDHRPGPGLPDLHLRQHRRAQGRHERPQQRGLRDLVDHLLPGQPGERHRHQRPAALLRLRPLPAPDDLQVRGNPGPGAVLHLSGPDPQADRGGARDGLPRGPDDVHDAGPDGPGELRPLQPPVPHQHRGGPAAQPHPAAARQVPPHHPVLDVRAHRDQAHPLPPAGPAGPASRIRGACPSPGPRPGWRTRTAHASVPARSGSWWFAAGTSCGATGRPRKPRPGGSGPAPCPGSGSATPGTSSARTRRASSTSWPARTTSSRAAARRWRPRRSRTSCTCSRA